MFPCGGVRPAPFLRGSPEKTAFMRGELGDGVFRLAFLYRFFGLLASNVLS